MRKFSQPLQVGKAVGFDFSHLGHALVTLYVQFLCSDWSRFDRWAVSSCRKFTLHLETCNCSLIAEGDRVLCHLVMLAFDCHFPQDVQNEIYSCYQDSSVVHGWIVYWVFV